MKTLSIANGPGQTRAECPIENPNLRSVGRRETIPPPREQVDSNVQAFRGLDTQTAFVLGNDGNLWLEHGPFQNIPPDREQVDGSVQRRTESHRSSGCEVTGSPAGEPELRRPHIRECRSVLASGNPSQ